MAEEITKAQIELVTKWLAQGHAAPWASSVSSQNLPVAISTLLKLALKPLEPNPARALIVRLSAAGDVLNDELSLAACGKLNDHVEAWGEFQKALAAIELWLAANP